MTQNASGKEPGNGRTDVHRGESGKGASHGVVSELTAFLTLALSTPTYSSAYRDAAIDGITRLAQLQNQPRREPMTAA